MLIEFSVANFRSFRERQTLSLVAAPRLRKRENCFKPHLSGENFPSLLKACVVYGPNASGKSNLIKALYVIGIMASATPDNDRSALPFISPFAFDPDLKDEPSEFDVHFIVGGARYQFTVAATGKRIFYESLRQFPRGEEELIYERKYTEGVEKYEFGGTAEGGEALFDVWKKLTSPTSLFISRAVANSSEELNQLRRPFAWLKEGMMVLDEMSDMERMARTARDLATDNGTHANDIAAFLREVDVPVVKIKSEKLSPPGLESAKQLSKSAIRTKLTHSSALGEAELDYSDESVGTQKLIGFWLPWTLKPLDRNVSWANVLIVDELDSSLHPLIVESLVSKHIEADTPSQLIFTTHDTHLMDSRLLRRDQIWLTERDKNGATVLRSIHDFQGREGEDIEKRYFEGRYRSLPVLVR